MKGISTIKARAETVAKSPTYREPFKKRRCLVPASGFYEWKKLDDKNKQPFAFDLTNGYMMAFAGLWDAWKDPANGKWLQTYTIITTDANELMARVHNRMPVILHPGEFDRWLSREETHQPPIDLLRPFPADEMEAFEVSKEVGNVKNNSPELLNSRSAAYFLHQVLDRPHLLRAAKWAYQLLCNRLSLSRHLLLARVRVDRAMETSGAKIDS